jgi:hypothetical protein
MIERGRNFDDSNSLFPPHRNSQPPIFNDGSSYNSHHALNFYACLKHIVPASGYRVTFMMALLSTGTTGCLSSNTACGDSFQSGGHLIEMDT